RYGPVVDRDDHVALLDAGLGGRPARRDAPDQFATVPRDPERGGDILVDLLQGHAHIAALRTLAAAKRIDHRPRLFRRNGETHADVAAGRRDQRGIDADHIALEIEHRAAGIAHVDGGVRLDVAVVDA